MLNELLQSRGLNIKNIVFSEPNRRDRILFDPRRDVMPEEWQTMKNRLAEIRSKRRTIEEYINMAADLVRLLPERRSELGIDAALAVSVADDLQDRRIGHALTRDWIKAVRYAASIKQVFPHISSDSLLTDQQFTECSKTPYRENQINLKMLFPAKPVLDSYKTDVEWERDCNYLDQRRKHLCSPITPHDYSSIEQFIIRAAFMRLTFHDWPGKVTLSSAE